MMTVRRADERGRTRIGWLDGRHSFSFGRYHDPKWMGYRTLRVINDDIVAPGGGFPEHPHEDMEIITYVVSGTLAHKDSTGKTATLGPGGIQRMSAGRGIRHSEFNASKTEPVRLLQIWIEPDRAGHEPGFEDGKLTVEARRGRWAPIASPDGAGGSFRIHQDARVFATILGAGERLDYALGSERHAWVQVVRGEVEVNGVALREGDGASVAGKTALGAVARSEAEVLLFDLS